MPYRWASWDECETDRLAVEQDLAGIGRLHSGHDLDQGRLARAVLAQQRMHLAAA